jgi:hypothetical protein
MKHRGSRCYFCGVEFNTCGPGSKRTIDHLVPRSAGGTNDPENLVHACYLCNHKKGEQPLKDFEASGWLTRKRIEVFRREIRINYRYTHQALRFLNPGWECTACNSIGTHDESPCLVPCVD